MTEKRILIGEISTVHGIKGFVKIRSYVEDERLLEGHSVFTHETENAKIRIILKNRIKDDWIAAIDGIADRTQAETLRGTKLYLARDDMPDPGDDAFYIEDLKGLRAMDENDHEIGMVLSVENFGASDLLDIKPKDGGQSFYIPFTDDVVLNIDLEKGQIILRLPQTI